MSLWVCTVRETRVALAKGQGTKDGDGTPPQGEVGGSPAPLNNHSKLQIGQRRR